MNIEKMNCRKCPQICLLLLTLLLCASCGAKIIKGEPPLIRLTELSHRDNNINLQLNLRNVNGIDLNVRSIDLRLTVNEDQDELIVYTGPVETIIVANGTESWSVEVAENDTARTLLNKLENGEIKSLPYLFQGTVSSEDEGRMPFEYEGHLYPLPGRPGHFR